MLTEGIGDLVVGGDDVDVFFRVKSCSKAMCYPCNLALASSLRHSACLLAYETSCVEH